MTQKKTVPPEKISLSATELALAHKFGMTPKQYAEYVVASRNPNWPMPADRDEEDTDEDNEDDYDNDPNKQEIMNAPIKALCDIWEVKFGSRWVEVDSLDEEWDKIYGRLMEYDLLEEFDGGMWVKLKEKL